MGGTGPAGQRRRAPGRGQGRRRPQTDPAPGGRDHRRANAVNGDIVKAGKVLVRLDNTQAKAQLDLLQNRIDTREALAARLRAERDGKDEIEFNQALLGKPDPAAGTQWPRSVTCSARSTTT